MTLEELLRSKPSGLPLTISYTVDKYVQIHIQHKGFVAPDTFEFRGLSFYVLRDDLISTDDFEHFGLDSTGGQHLDPDFAQ